MRIFLTGASGYVGSAILDGFVRAGHQVTGLVRHSENAAKVAERGGAPVCGNLLDPASYRAAAAGHDVFVHAGFDATNGAEADRTAIETLIEAARAGEPGRARLLVYTSGIWVLGATSAPATEDAALNPAALVAFRPAHEQRVLSAGGDGLRTAVVRPGIVFGGSRGIVGDIFRDAANGLVRVIGPGDNRWPAVYDRDLGELYLRLALRSDASGIFHATDETDERVNDIVEAIAAHAPTPPDVRRVPLAEAQKKMGPYALALALDQVVRSPRARAIGWTPAVRSITGNAARLFDEWRTGTRLEREDGERGQAR
jgi:nucleoside-diphosphate-sugar epimerase